MGCGTLLQIVAYGSQDIYLTGNPQITYFKAVYKRYTNFAIESVQQNFIGGIKLQNGNANNIKTKGTLCKYSSIINRVGDLLLDMHIELDISQPTEKNEFGDIILSKFVKRPAYALIDFIELLLKPLNHYLLILSNDVENERFKNFTCANRLIDRKPTLCSG